MEIKEVKTTKSFKRDIEKIVKLLKGQGCTEIYLFGSSLSDNTKENSDIDIGVRGCPGAKFFRIHSKLSDELERPVDLVDFDSEEDFFSMLDSIGEIIQIG